MYKFLIVFSIISFLSIVWYGIESYIDYKAEIISTNHILNHHLDIQNEAIKKNELQLDYFKTQEKVIYKYIEKKVPVVTTTKDSTCEAKLDDIENIFKSF